MAVRITTTPQAAFEGRFPMLAYLIICLATFVACVVCMRKKQISRGGAETQSPN